MKESPKRPLPIGAVITIVVVVFIVSIGPLAGLVHYLEVSYHLDANTLGMVFAGGLLGLVLLLLLRARIGAFFMRAGAFLQHIAADPEENFSLEETVPDSPAAVDARFWLEEGKEQRPEEAEPVLHLAPDCPLSFSSAFNHTLILERPGAALSNRSVAARLYPELFGEYALPQLILTRNPSYVSLLPHFANGWLAGHPDARQNREIAFERFRGPGMSRLERYADLFEQNARKFVKSAIDATAQVVVDLSTYPDPDQAGRVLVRLLTGIQEQGNPCIVTITEADRWFPNDRWLVIPDYRITNDPALSIQARSLVEQLLTTNYGIVYLVVESLMPMLQLARKCLLWTLNMEPDEEDQAFISIHTGLPLSGLDLLKTHSILADVTSRTVMPVVLNQQQSLHEDPRMGHQTRGSAKDLSRVEADEESSLGK
jgi:hypothetical protein